MATTAFDIPPAKGCRKKLLQLKFSFANQISQLEIGTLKLETYRNLIIHQNLDALLSHTFYYFAGLSTMVRLCCFAHGNYRSLRVCTDGIRCEFAHSKEEERLESQAELHCYRSLATQEAKTRFIRGEIGSKIILQKNRWEAKAAIIHNIIDQKNQWEAKANAIWSTQTNSRWHDLQKPVQHVTWDNKKDLSSVPYMVSPKADGVRKMLLCERTTGDIYLMGTNSKTPVQVAGAKGNTIRGFVLDTEEVILSSGDRLVVAFDVLAIDYGALGRLSIAGGWDVGTLSLFLLPKPHKVLTINSLEQRYQLLKDLVGTISMSHLIVKPLWPTSKTEFVWKMYSSLPYPVDGLIFVPMSAKNSSSKKTLRTFKWKPTDKLTIDVAVGDGSALTNEPSGKVFVPYLYSPPRRDYTWQSDYSSLYSDLAQITRARHAPFQVDCKANGEVFVQEVQRQHYAVFSDLESDDDIRLTNAEDLAAINRQRRLENELWLKESGSCGNEECFCTEVFPSGNAVSHCNLCGVLVVNTHQACLDCNGQGGRQAMRESSVLIPPEDSAWAAHQIIEVKFDICTGTFHFIRIRRDRLMANSAEQIKYILELQLRPIGLSDLSFYSEESRACDISPLVLPYRIPTKGKSKFKSLRDLHHGIKGTIYRLFGGNLIVDACCGGLHDKSNWEESGSKQVLAIDQDSEQLERAKERIQNARERPSTVAIQIVHADLSQPCSLGKAARAMWTDTTDKSRGQADTQLLGKNDEFHNAESVIDTVFCHFALHFFWATRETSSTFLQNLVPLLRDSGLFVVTYMRAEIIREQKIVKILNDDGEVEFEAKLHQQDENVQVFVASIGKRTLKVLSTMTR